MIILHGATADGRLVVWGETSEPPKRKGRLPRTDPAPSRAAMLPLHAGEDLLRHALATANVVTRAGLARPLVASLPTKGGAPLPSSVLVSDDAEPDTRAPTKPWTVTAIPLPPGHAIALLRAAAQKPLITPGVAGGDDLRFFCSVLRFAATLVASGHFVPSIARDRAAFHARKEPLVRFRGRWVHVTAEDIRAALALWKRKGGPLTAREVIGLALGAPSEQGPLPLDGVETSGWLDDLLKQLKGQAPMESLAPPEAFEGTLRPYQARGLSWLHPPRVPHVRDRQLAARGRTLHTRPASSSTMAAAAPAAGTSSRSRPRTTS